MLAWRDIALIAVIPVFSVTGLYGAMLQEQMIGKINPLLPADKRFTPLTGSRLRFYAVRDEYRRLFPDGTLRRRQTIVYGTGLAAFVFVACDLLAFR